MPNARLEKARSLGLPEGYQFGVRPGDIRVVGAGQTGETLSVVCEVPQEHEHHEFNAVSGYCRCGVQYLPHLLRYFEFGGRVGEGPPSWMPDTRPQFVTVLGPGDTVKPQ